jgi:hypothetical protein
MTQANEIRCYVMTAILRPAWRRGRTEVTFSASDVGNGMALVGRYPNICQVLDAEGFADLAGVRKVGRRGPPQSSTAEWTFAIDGEPHDFGVLVGC